MDMKIPVEWLLKRAEAEGNMPVSVGGLVVEVQKKEKELTVQTDCLDCAEDKIV